MSLKINIPSDVASVIYKRKIYKAFLVFVYLKLNAKSSFVESDVTGILTHGESLLGLKYRTIKVHFEKLIKLKWIGQDQNGIYYLRSMETIRKKLGLKSKISAPATSSDLKTLEEFISSAFLALSLKNQETTKWIYKNKNRKSQVAQKQLAANLRDDFFYEYNYCGMSSAGLAQKLGISRSKSQRHLIGADKIGYIKLKKKVMLLLSGVTSADVNAFKRSGLHENHKLRVRPSKGRFSFTFDVVKQLHNEVISNVKLKRNGIWVNYEDSGVLACF